MHGLIGRQPGSAAVLLPVFVERADGPFFFADLQFDLPIDFLPQIVMSVRDRSRFRVSQFRKAR
jgi:hypothetical protein